MPSYRFMKAFGRRGYSAYQKKHPINPLTTVESVFVTHQHDYVYHTLQVYPSDGEDFSGDFVAKQIQVPIERWEFRNGTMTALLAFVEEQNKVLWITRRPKRLEI